MEQRVFIGESSVEDFYNLLSLSAVRRMFLVRGNQSYEASGAKEIIKNIILRTGCEIIEFFDFENNPKYEDVQKGVALLQSSNIDLIIAIGGGSVLDMAKLIRFYNSYSGNFIDNEFIKEKGIIPLYTLPTTAGTGSEVTHFAVMYKDKIKYSVSHKDILPDVAVIYPPFTYNNSPYLTACTGFDALSQAIEAYWNVNATEESDQYALKAIELLWPNLNMVVNEPNEIHRKFVSEGSYWAGKAINITKTTAPHAFSYPFTTYYGIPHGHAVALTFPYFFEYNCSLTKEGLAPSVDADKFFLKMRRLFDLLQVDIEKMNLNEFFYNYLKQLGLNYAFPFDISRQKISENVNIQRLNNNPRLVSDVDAVIEDVVIKQELNK